MAVVYAGGGPEWRSLLPSGGGFLPLPAVEAGATAAAPTDDAAPMTAGDAAPEPIREPAREDPANGEAIAEEAGEEKAEARPKAEERADVNEEEEVVVVGAAAVVPRVVAVLVVGGEDATAVLLSLSSLRRLVLTPIPNIASTRRQTPRDT